MLLDARTLRGLQDGTVTLAFRRWTTPRVKVGTLQRTRIGVVEVTSVERVAVGPDGAPLVSDDEARLAGMASLERVLARGAAREGDLYRVGIRLAGPDPRVALREDADLDAAAVEQIRAALDRKDRAAAAPWTRQYLELVAANEGVVARELAAGLGMARDDFKVRVRRLKELGLTESLDVGYRLSPRGRAYLDATSPGS
ncbi:ASCH domain-containing protein [Cellulosimicrobium cellulans]|uniref:ASCH domain-containing protein n=1 Tax=Cellulosimicrobium cellulans TaxID=1710 RepID=UPI00209762A8|nr:ASCH domain-containing protein [Cellulosimicrobium cellulans]MCO7275424.1 ASCH domain-containing protein [Cellulosimicrobium cellulans]